MQPSPGRKPWEVAQDRKSALKGRRSLLRPFRAFLSRSLLPRAQALGCAVPRFQRAGSLFPDAINSTVTVHQCMIPNSYYEKYTLQIA